MPPTVSRAPVVAVALIPLRLLLTDVAMSCAVALAAIAMLSETPSVTKVSV